MIQATVQGQGDITALRFSTTRALRFDGSPEDLKVIKALSETILSGHSRTAIFGTGALARYFLEMDSELDQAVDFVVSFETIGSFMDRPVIAPTGLPEYLDSVLLASNRWREVAAMCKAVPDNIRTSSLADLPEIDLGAVPSYAWLPKVDSIYPMAVPKIHFKAGMDLILLDLPARSLAQLPVGFAYVHDALSRESSISFQTIDADIVIYHRYHADRILDGVKDVRTATGRLMPPEPWDPSAYLLWKEDDVLDLFENDIQTIVSGLTNASPKILACSLQEANLSFTSAVVTRVKQNLPDLIVIGGGMSCLQPGAAKFIFPLADYIVVGEADITMPRLVKLILDGKAMSSIPGVWAKNDPTDKAFRPGEIPTHLDEYGHPRYEWTDLNLYRLWNNYRLAPVVGSRGCSWSKCRFCGERFNWRTRDPIKIVDDLEFFVDRGFDKVVFNESDFHGDTKLIDQLCDEIIRRKIGVSMTVQLRCSRHGDAAYYHKLYAAGFRLLRFGVDAWADNTLRRQNKGYNKATIRQSLRLATQAGIFTEVNIVLGIPGETEADVDESIDLLIEMKPWIGRIAFINPLMLFRGSDYWNEPEKYNIHFKGDKDALYAQHPVALPNSLWQSEDPYIDEAVRYRRFLKVVNRLREVGFDMTNWVNFTVEKVEEIAETIDREHKQSLGATHDLISADFYRGFILKKCDSGYQAVPDGDDKTDLPRNFLRAAAIADLRFAVDLYNDLAAGDRGYLPFLQNGEIFGLSMQKLAMQVVATSVPDNPPGNYFVFMVAAYKQYNICRLDDVFYAVPIGIGHVNLTKPEDRNRDGILVGLTLKHVKMLVDQMTEK